MELNTTSVTSSIANSSSSGVQVTGWNPSDTTRGSIDILWSCCVTIVLCCWVSTFPNVPSPTDKWYHPLVDKLNLAFIGFLGPDYLFGIALGQLSSARRSVKSFRELSHLSGGRDWTLVHGFFADMGGFVLVSPDYPSFPINAEQLHYLIKNGHVAYPTLTKADIKALSKTDGLSKLLTFWQVLWFSTAELQRISQGLPVTTFELTALSFSLTMLLTSLCWYAKPTISLPTTLRTKDDRTIESIRATARDSTHPGLPSKWYRTPLDFISPTRRFRVDVHWSYYTQFSYLTHLPLFSRKIKTCPWDRMPSDVWLLIDPALLAPAFIVILGFSLSPLAAWNFYFPTDGEKIVWRVCSVFHAMQSVALGLYYAYATMLETKKISDNTRGPDPHTSSSPLTPLVEHPEATQSIVMSEFRQSKGGCDVETASVSSDPVRTPSRGRVQTTLDWIKSWRNISPDGDPEMTLGLHAILPPLIATFFYILCRLFFYIEDFIAIRQQPVDVYKAMNKYLPFMG